ncbi:MULTISPECIES: hydroxymethylglutaryl-CoA lyase [unclassified Ectothiorhodospira]|jgi:isopropylmalate/homocitrate/citramalate synthase|uniref:hydroxymethylglutaryl-CoA lyase n=1 Tax=unclassified Ectothiorhodospira TaxID=2684909 RepID=UPI001EE827D4|nr:MULTISPECIES: hydroxymethylglutaryl-CoA lyase [unclassified Ectothiorhodospira]MCG5515426.1 hydroxymethylglutaryl-CoA lyase [Ectothiorhodospira sp. 9100]MCG5518221.1 hydroxymethylglutaryl-CoA lyase [Ectothiorhodospira sp. 9905]
MPLPHAVNIVEVGPRDGLQNEPGNIDTNVKLELIGRLVDAGLRQVEATAFVSPRWVPQMADHTQVMAGLPNRPGVRFPVLTPNLKGFENAVAAGAREVAVFAAASEAFSRKNINCSIAESLERFEPVLAQAQEQGILVRGYLSCTLGCPYEGDIAPEAVTRVARRLYDMGCYQISLGDTVGTGTPLKAQRMVETVAEQVPLADLAAHFHDTYGQALANLFAVLKLGISTVDCSVGGLGGCPYARGASGNVATEEVVYMLHGMGVETGVDLRALVDTVHWIHRQLDRPVQSRVARAMGE